MLELWMIKTGRIKQSIEDESSGHAPLYWGKQLEPLVAEYYSMHTNNKVRRINAVLQHLAKSDAQMIAVVNRSRKYQTFYGSGATLEAGYREIPNPHPIPATTKLLSWIARLGARKDAERQRVSQ
ncbi:hypothetical protein GGI1_24876 [Acidithiobacillus sp. GGI-221]|nr:hypothetical protein GGI1_24876 [Acidithiobacillus sp. GGI-221]